MDRIKQRGIIGKQLKGHKFEVRLQDMPLWKVIAYLCGQMRRKRITLVSGDEVALELSPYDLRRGRILWRHTL